VIRLAGSCSKLLSFACDCVRPSMKRFGEENEDVGLQEVIGLNPAAAAATSLTR
jgi:hypothetical protein